MIYLLDAIAPIANNMFRVKDAVEHFDIFYKIVRKNDVLLGRDVCMDFFFGNENKQNILHAHMNKVINFEYLSQICIQTFNQPLHKLCCFINIFFTF